MSISSLAIPFFNYLQRLSPSNIKISLTFLNANDVYQTETANYYEVNDAFAPSRRAGEVLIRLYSADNLLAIPPWNVIPALVHHAHDINTTY